MEIVRTEACPSYNDCVAAINAAGFDTAAGRIEPSRL
jgi:hypothetical protein